ncbi:MAG: DLW-39 family protein [Acidimicrobiia bacterium]|nr:DLW-39 family protein [Acidimicrobiia bacterium]
MKKLILVALAAAGGAAVYKLLNSEYKPPAKP